MELKRRLSDFKENVQEHVTKKVIITYLILVALVFLSVNPIISLKRFTFGGDVVVNDQDIIYDFMDLSNVSAGEDFITTTNVIVQSNSRAYVAGLFMLLDSESPADLLYYFEILRVDVGGTLFDVVDDDALGAEFQEYVPEEGYWFIVGTSVEPFFDAEGEHIVPVYAYGRLEHEVDTFSVGFAIEVIQV